MRVRERERERNLTYTELWHIIYRMINYSLEIQSSRNFSKLMVGGHF